MTMIAFVPHEDHAEIMTDSIAYRADGTDTVLSPHDAKVLHLPGIAGALVTQGIETLAMLWQPLAGGLSRKVRDFDQFTRGCERALPEVFRAARELAITAGVDPDYFHGAGLDCAAFHIGYSPAAGRFVACGYTSIDDQLHRFELDGMTVMPAPGSPVTPAMHRIGPIEASHALKIWLANHGDDGVRALKRWLALPPQPTPANTTQWADLARTVHRTRSLECDLGDSRVLIGGDVHLARLDRDGMTVQKIHTFDDPDEFRQMVRGTGHDLDPEREQESDVEPARELVAA